MGIKNKKVYFKEKKFQFCGINFLFRSNQKRLIDLIYQFIGHHEIGSNSNCKVRVDIDKTNKDNFMKIRNDLLSDFDSVKDKLLDYDIGIFKGLMCYRLNKNQVRVGNLKKATTDIYYADKRYLNIKGEEFKIRLHKTSTKMLETLKNKFNEKIYSKKDKVDFDIRYCNGKKVFHLTNFFVSIYDLIRFSSKTYYHRFTKLENLKYLPKINISIYSYILKKYIMMHCSGICDKNGAILFFGKSKSGKSTINMMSFMDGFKSLGDESVLIKYFPKGNFKVYPVCSHLELRSKSKKICENLIYNLNFQDSIWNNNKKKHLFPKIREHYVNPFKPYNLNRSVYFKKADFDNKSILLKKKYLKDYLDSHKHSYSLLPSYSEKYWKNFIENLNTHSECYINGYDIKDKLKLSR